jgi:hypothetical protein
MNNFIFSTFSVSYLLTVLFFSGLIAPAFGQISGKASLSDKKITLTRKIDSLDLVKQTQKRLGTSIDELELQQTSLRDSLRMIRKSIQNKSPDTETPRGNFASNLLKPQNLFDWIVLIVGGVATMSGIVLLWGILKILFSFKKKPVHNTSAPFKKISLSEPHTDKPDFNSPVPDPEFGKLRERLNFEHVPNSVSTAPVFQYPDSPQKASHPSPINLQYSKTVSEQTIIAAAQNGMDITEISRNFQISTDHVTLILKIAGIKFLKT